MVQQVRNNLFYRQEEQNMEPVVSPFLIYLVYVADWVKITAICLAILSLTASTFFYTIEEKRHSKIVSIFGVIMLLIGVLTPTRDAMVAMIVAQYITPENLSAANETLKTNMKDYVEILVSIINK